jgi:hypothetical protein
MNNRNILKIVLQIGIITILFWLLFNPAYLFHGNIKGDDASYVAHTFTIALDGDLDYCNEINFNKKGCLSGTGRTAPPHPIGTGIVHAPFVKLFSFIDVLQDNPVLGDRNQYIGSWSFLGIFISVTCCFIVGLLCYINTIETLTKSFPRWLIMLMVAGYGIPYYIFQRFTMSHGPEFLFLALLLWSSVKILYAEGQKKYFLFFLLALSIGMTYLIRPANINATFIPVIVSLLSEKITGRKEKILRSSTDWLYFSSSFLIILLFVLAINNNLYRVYFPNSEQVYGFRIGRIPESLSDKIRELWDSKKFISTILFSSEFGLVFSAPVLVFGSIAALYLGLKKQQAFISLQFIVAFLLYIGIPFSVVLFWKNPADAYGYRYLYTLAPISILGLCIFFERNNYWLFGIPKKIFVFLSLFAILGQVFYATSEMFTPTKKMNAFGRFEKFSSDGYEKNLAKAVFDIKSWKSVFAKRYPGFLAVQILNENNTRQIAEKMKLPENKFLEVFSNLKKSPAIYKVFITIYGFILPLLFWYILCFRRSYKRTV